MFNKRVDIYICFQSHCRTTNDAPNYVDTVDVLALKDSVQVSAIAMGYVWSSRSMRFRTTVGLRTSHCN